MAIASCRLGALSSDQVEIDRNATDARGQRPAGVNRRSPRLAGLPSP